MCGPNVKWVFFSYTKKNNNGWNNSDWKPFMTLPVTHTASLEPNNCRTRDTLQITTEIQHKSAIFACAATIQVSDQSYLDHVMTNIMQSWPVKISKCSALHQEKVVLNFAMFRHSLQTFKETRLHGKYQLIFSNVQLLYTIPSELTINTDYKHQ